MSGEGELAISAERGGAPARGAPPGPTASQSSAQHGREAAPLDLISCDGCGRSFAAADGPAMLAAITGGCPSCGGTFRLAGLTTE